MSFSSPEFWFALLQIIGVNIILSGDNAVVIALAARSLPHEQQKKAVAWGSGAAVVMRIGLTIVAVELLRMPYLKLVGSGLLLWIALQLLLPEHEGEGHAQASNSLAGAIKTILVADLVMSLDNVIAVAAAAKGDMTLLVVGLAISIPMVIFASTLLLNLMGRFPVIITAGAALLGWVAGEMAISDPAVKLWIDAEMSFLHYLAPAVGAIGVVVIGKWLAARAEAGAAAPAEPAARTAPAAMSASDGLKHVLLAVDGSEDSQKAVRQVIAMRAEMRDPGALALHLVNVQAPVTHDVSNFIANQTLEEYHKERSDASLTPARALLDAAQLSYQVHEKIGEPAQTIAALASQLGCAQIVMGTRGLGAGAAALIGSVAQRVVEHAAVPVLLAK